MNDKGFSPLSIVLAIVVVGAIAGVGYYVYRSQDTTKNGDATSSQQQQPDTTQQTDTPKQDETASWKTVESIGGAFTIKVPDGWELFNYPGNLLIGNAITYTPGKPAVIHTEPQAYAGDQKKFNVGISDQASDAPQWQSPNPNGKETSSDYAIGDLKGKRYSIEWLESVTGVNKGDKVYQYVFNLAGGKQLGIVYQQAATDADNLKLVEQVIQTIVVK